MGTPANVLKKKFNRLKVLSFAYKDKWHSRYWRCLCDCGNYKFVNTRDLQKNRVKSCGCLAKEVASKQSWKHGKVNTKAYSSWHHLKSRCNNPNDTAYKYYGAKGIKVCERWINSFKEFYKDMGDPPLGYVIDRINPYKGYYPENCRWITMVDNARNTRKTIFITFNNKTKCLAEWARILNFNYGNVHYNIRIRKHKMSFIKALIASIYYKPNRAGRSSPHDSPLCL